MTSAIPLGLLLFATVASAPVQLHLPEQSFVPNAAYPHPACVCLPQGWGKDTFLLRENGAAIASQTHVRSRWTDGSAKWLHVYAQYKYQDDKPAGYELSAAGDEARGDSSNGKPESDIKKFIPVLYCGDDLGREFKAGQIKTEKLDSGPIATVWHLAGEMISSHDKGDALMKVEPFLTFDTWVTLYSSRVDVEHAFTVAGAMRGVRIAELGLKLKAPEAWVGVLRDEGHRLPHKLKQQGPDVDVILWPKGGTRRGILNAHTLHLFPWMHSGQYLDFHAPDNAYELAKSLQTASEAPYRNAQGVLSASFKRSGAEWSETKAENLRTSTPEGLSVVCSFSLVKLATDASAGSLAEQAMAWRKLLQQKPVARPTSQWIADTEALGPIAPRSKKYEAFEKQIDNARLAFHDPEKTAASGWANFGNAPERMVPVRGSAGATLAAGRNRVFQHRACSYNHYWLHPVWLQVLRGGPQSVLDTARRTTAYLAAFGQCRHSTLRKDGQPVTRGKILWGFYHSVNFYPWGTTDYGLGWPDVECALVGHWVDPYALQLSWLYDCNWFAKQGYDGWAQAVPMDLLSFGRESNSTLAQWIFAYRHYAGMAGQEALAKKFLEGARRMAAIMITVPLQQQVASGTIGVLWYPTWPLLADEILQTPASRQYVIDSATYLASLPKGPEGITPVAVIVRAVELGADTKLLEAVLPPKPIVGGTNGFQLGPGPLGEGHQAIAWPTALKSLQRLDDEK